MPYRTFLTHNVASAVGWSILSVMLGYLGGSSRRHVGHIASRVGLGALVLLVLIAAVGVLFRRTGPHRFHRLVAALAASRPVRGTFLRPPPLSVAVLAQWSIGHRTLARPEVPVALEAAEGFRPGRRRRLGASMDP